MAHKQIHRRTRTNTGAPPLRTRKLRLWGLFASTVAAMGTLIVATSPPGAADPFPQCGDPDPAQCPAGSDVPGRDAAGPGCWGSLPWQCVFQVPNPGDEAKNAPPDAWLPHANDDQLPAAAGPLCPQGMHYSFTMGDCESDR
jgi:hypothetical protein